MKNREYNQSRDGVEILLGAFGGYMVGMFIGNVLEHLWNWMF